LNKYFFTVSKWSYWYYLNKLFFFFSVYRVSWVLANCFCVQRIKLSQKAFYHFATFMIIVNKIFITKNCQILVLNNFLLKYNQLSEKLQETKNYLFSSHRILSKNFFRIFYHNFLVHFLIFINMRKYGIKKFWKNSEKILRTLWEENKWFLSLAVFL